MTAYREIIKNSSDIARVKAILDSIKSETEIIILPIENGDEEVFVNAQEGVMAMSWDNEYDGAWDDV